MLRLGCSLCGAVLTRMYSEGTNVCRDQRSVRWHGIAGSRHCGYAHTVSPPVLIDSDPACAHDILQALFFRLQLLTCPKCKGKGPRVPTGRPATGRPAWPQRPTPPPVCAHVLQRADASGKWRREQGGRMDGLTLSPKCVWANGVPRSPTDALEHLST
jgi:hypothetical protein